MGKISCFLRLSIAANSPRTPWCPWYHALVSSLAPALISIILEQHRGVFEKIYIFSPSINIDNGWIPVKKYGVNTEREQAYYGEWDEAALRGIIQRQRKITETSKKLEMKKLYQVLIILDSPTASSSSTTLSQRIKCSTCALKSVLHWKEKPMGAAQLSGPEAVCKITLINARCENIFCCTSVAAVQPPIVCRTGGFLKKRITTIYVDSRMFFVTRALGALSHRSRERLYKHRK